MPSQVRDAILGGVASAAGAGRSQPGAAGSAQPQAAKVQAENAQLATAVATAEAGAGEHDAGNGGVVATSFAPSAPLAASGAAPAAPESHSDGLLTYVPFHPVAPTRRVVLAWRKSFTRAAAIDMLRKAVLKLDQPGVTILPDEKPTTH